MTGLTNSTSGAKNARFVSKARSSASLLEIQEAERRSIARELHDGIGQSVTALGMELARVCPKEDGHSMERLLRARALTGQILEMIRNISMTLSPAILDDLGLKAALEWHIQDFSARTKIECKLVCLMEDKDGLAPPLRLCIYRVIQEALNNCEKHAGATNVEVRVGLDEGMISVAIADNGRGIPAAAKRMPGLGIPGMKDRAALAGGTLTIETSERKGTIIRLKVPANAAKRQRA